MADSKKKRAPKPPYSTVYWPDQQTKDLVAMDAARFHKTDSEFIGLCCGARRNPVLLIELAGMFGTKTPDQMAGPARGSMEAELKEAKDELARSQELRAQAEERAADLQARLDQSEMERRSLLDRVVRESEAQGMTLGLVSGLGSSQDAPPLEAVRALDALTRNARGGAQQWVYERTLVDQMKKEEGVSDAAEALVIMRRAAKHQLVVTRGGRWALTPGGRVALMGGA